ncbi:hypothetical protein ALC57_13308 [Trachymyrmex cornetzi]|uniref:Myb/SANT-like DNA-binding domain-containing protein n=1 Tax=Trachymyrmex cornetzi TaxID=471704 RepID=A0A151IZJ7_9HYME|nr:hypothetical protein ALC57_13308 [Trachymyrmex cornetzi]
MYAFYDDSNVFIIIKFPIIAFLTYKLIKAVPLSLHDHFATVEKQGFQKFMKVVAPLYKIPSRCLKHGYLVTGPQCLSKFSGLKRTYKIIKDHNKKPGSGTRTWPYLSLMDDLLGTKPFMSPVSTTFTNGKRSRAESEQSDCSQTSSNEDKENSTPNKLIILYK